MKGLNRCYENAKDDLTYIFTLEWAKQCDLHYQIQEGNEPVWKKVRDDFRHMWE